MKKKLADSTLTYLHVATEADRKFRQLQTLLKSYLTDGAVVAFSGGVDSSFLLWTAEKVRRKHGGALTALTTVSPSLPRKDMDDAKRFAKQIGVNQVWEDSREFLKDEYLRNDKNRCYYCKSELFQITKKHINALKYRWVLYGYNASDCNDVRPGHRAALENGVVSPLAEVGLTKKEIRSVMHHYQLELADKQASPCLSSRVMTGIPITKVRLEDIEALESILRKGGLNTFRVRLCSQGRIYFLRIEVSPSEMLRVLGIREELLQEGQSRGYRWVTLDLGGYRMGGGTV